VTLLARGPGALFMPLGVDARTMPALVTGWFEISLSSPAQVMPAPVPLGAAPTFGWGARTPSPLAALLTLAPALYHLPKAGSGLRLRRH